MQVKLGLDSDWGVVVVWHP